MELTAGLTRELFEGGVRPEDGKRFLQERETATEVTHYVAGLLGNDNPRPPKRAFYDRSLKGTGVLAWYLDPQEVQGHIGRQIREELGEEPVIAYNPRVVAKYLKGTLSPDLMNAVENHEKGHGGQPAKQEIKRAGALTRYGFFPLGEALIEGSVEYALDRRHAEMKKRGRKVARAPTHYFEENLGRGEPVPHYVHYRNFVYELEEAQPGIVRQFFRAAKRASVEDAMRLLEKVPGINDIVEKYSLKLMESRRN